MRKGEEMVMAVPRSELLGGAEFQGLRAGGAEWLGRVFAPGQGRYLPRSAAETDANWKQIIPYVVLYCGERICVYRRGRGTSETRLAALHSVGLGGHIRQSDESLFARPGWPSYRQALERELGEEVGLPAGSPVRDRLAGVINDDSTEVGQVHFGLVHLWELAKAEVESRERKIEAPRFVALEELRSGAVGALESWSAFCIEHWEELQRQAGWTDAR